MDRSLNDAGHGDGGSEWPDQDVYVWMTTKDLHMKE